MEDQDLDTEVAVKVMGWEVLDVGYFGTEEETPRMPHGGKSRSVSTKGLYLNPAIRLNSLLFYFPKS